MSIGKSSAQRSTHNHTKSQMCSRGRSYVCTTKGDTAWGDHKKGVPPQVEDRSASGKGPQRNHTHLETRTKACVKHPKALDIEHRWHCFVTQPLAHDVIKVSHNSSNMKSFRPLCYPQPNPTHLPPNRGGTHTHKTGTFGKSWKRSRIQVAEVVDL